MWIQTYEGKLLNLGSVLMFDLRSYCFGGHPDAQQFAVVAVLEQRIEDDKERIEWIMRPTLQVVAEAQLALIRDALLDSDLLIVPGDLSAATVRDIEEPEFPVYTDSQGREHAEF